MLFEALSFETIDVTQSTAFIKTLPRLTPGSNPIVAIDLDVSLMIDRINFSRYGRLIQYQWVGLEGGTKHVSVLADSAHCLDIITSHPARHPASLSSSQTAESLVVNSLV